MIWGKLGFHCGFGPMFACPINATEWNPALWLFPPQKLSPSLPSAKERPVVFKDHKWIRGDFHEKEKCKTQNNYNSKISLLSGTTNRV
jgi:hypothetical protein